MNKTKNIETGRKEDADIIGNTRNCFVYTVYQDNDELGIMERKHAVICVLITGFQRETQPPHSYSRGREKRMCLKQKHVA